MSERQRADRVMQRINELAIVSEREDCIARTYGTPAFIRGRDMIRQWMNKAGLKTWVDNIGNIRGRILSANPAAKTFVIASHIDTVINAGRFDGPLGVLLGLDLCETLVKAKTNLPFHIELIGFCDEEGCRFHTTYLGSKAVAGLFDKDMLKIRDAAGITLEQAIMENGGDVNNLSKDAIAQEDWLGYFEVHIEQGPVLYESDIPVAIVTAIAGQCRVEIRFAGEAGHAGTVPMDMRKDALTCAAEFVVETEKFAQANRKNIVATVGKLQVANAASNVVPGEVTGSLDLRSADETTLLSSYNHIQTIAENISQRRGITINWNLIQQTKPVSCDIVLNQHLAESIAKAGYSTVQLVSGAGHDAVPISQVAPVAMLFVKCFKGISHNPGESVEIEDVEATIRVSDNFLRQLIIHNS